jgi:hypothetical protein
MNTRTAIVIGLIAPAVTLAVCARADSPGYGFTAPPYDYNDEYRDCAWPDDGSGRRYVPGYPSDRERSRCGQEKAPPASQRRPEPAGLGALAEAAECVPQV